jgi:hypothetical protein
MRLQEARTRRRRELPDQKLLVAGIDVATYQRVAARLRVAGVNFTVQQGHAMTGLDPAGHGFAVPVFAIHVGAADLALARAATASLHVTRP